MRKYFHINAHRDGTNPDFEVGKTYITFPDSNRFWSFYRDYYPQVKMAAGHICGPARFAHYCHENKSIDLEGLRIIADTMKEAGMLLRELIFENVRKSDFPNLPSRQNSIWLTTESEVNYWINWLKQPGYVLSVFKVSGVGRFHSGNQYFLNSDIEGYNSYEKNATEYWKGTPVGEMGKFETLFHGNLSIEENVAAENFG